MLLNDFIVLDFSCVECFGLFDIVVLHLLPLEALKLMIFHCVTATTLDLDKSNHGLVAL